MGEFPALFLRMIVSMAVVIGLMVLAARMMNKRRSPMLRRGTHQEVGIEVLGRQGLTRTSSLAVVRVGDKTLLLGVTESSVTKLESNIATPLDLELEDLTNGSGATWTALSGNGEEQLADSSQSRKRMLEQLREMTVRRS